MNLNSTILEVDNLRIECRTDDTFQEVVHGISFSLQKGETLGILGESGSGKSLSCLAILQLLEKNAIKVTQGSILYHAENHSFDLLKLSEKEIQKVRGNRIGMIFQEPMTSLNPVKKCGKQVVEALQTHTKISFKEAKAKVLELFKEVMLPTPERIFNSYPFQLSGGQKQRVVIAMALICNPDILIADEPTTALDVTVQKNILELLKKLQERYQMGIIFISHDLGVIQQVAHRVMVLYQGRVVEQNTRENLLQNPQEAYTQGLLAAKPSMNSERLLHLPTVNDFVNKKELSQQTENLEERKERHQEIYSQKPIIRLENVVVSFPVKKNFWGKTVNSFQAVNKLSFSLYKGETLGLVGESGCGKTTLGRTILQLIKNQEGNIFYHEKALNQLSDSEMRKLRCEMQIVFQDPYASLNPRMTIGEILQEPMSVHKIYNTALERENRAFELLELVGIERQSFRRYPHQFSGGQRQRIAIARALALNPKFIICDESVSALDVSVQAQVLNLLNELKKEFGLTYLFISHDLSVVKYMSDRMVVMQSGNIVEMGEADLIYENPSSAYTQKLIDSIPLV